MRHVEGLWVGYERQVMPPDAGKIQRQETKRAFFAGVAAVLGYLQVMFDDDREPTEADLKVMSEVHAELEQFTKDVKAGRA